MSKRMKKMTTRSLVAIAAVAGAAALAATPASAVTITSASPTTGLSNGNAVNIQLSFGLSEANYAIAQCNDDQPDGLACNKGTSIGLIAVGSYPAGGENLTVNNTFTNGSLIPGVPPISGSTTCKGKSGSNCAVFVTTYDSGGKFVDQKQVGISFK